MHFKFVVLIAGLAFSAYPCVAQVDSSSMRIVVATVNQDTITAQQILLELGRLHQGQGDTTRSDFSLDKLVNKLVNDRLLIQDALEMQMDQDQDLRAEISEYSQEAAAEQVRFDALPDTFNVNDQEISAFYSRKFRQFHFFSLTLPRQEQADSLMGLIRRGTKLEDLASNYSTEIYRYNGGNLGLTMWINLESYLRQEADSMMVGDVRGPLPHRGAFTIIKLMEEKPADSSGLTQNREKIYAAIKQQKIISAREAYVKSLKQKYPVSINDSLLQMMAVLADSGNPFWQNPNQVVATVGNDSITTRFLIYKMLARGMAGSADRTRPVKAGALEEIIQDKIFRQEAAALNYASNPIVIQRTRTCRDSLLLINYLEQVVAPQIKIAPAAIDSFYHANLELYRAPMQVKISRISTTSEDSAKQVIERLKAGADFAWMAQRWSVDDQATKGGDYGWMSLEAFSTDLQQRIEKLPIGEIIGPYLSMDGYTVVKVTDRKLGEIRSLTAVKGLVHEQLYQLEFTKILDKVLEKLKESSHITINHKAMNNMIFNAKRGN